MSMACSIPPIRIKISAAKHSTAVVRSSKAEGPLRRPVAPLPPQPSLSSTPPLKPVAPLQFPSPPTAKPAEPVVASAATLATGPRDGVVTLEYQRRMAKELQEYFRQKKLEEADQGPVFGFMGRNEIANGRWAMFGFAVGLLTEYATGSDFVQQLKILFSNFGIVDLD